MLIIHNVGPEDREGEGEMHGTEGEGQESDTQGEYRGFRRTRR